MVGTRDGSLSKENNGYKCQKGYLYIGSSQSKCVSREDCIKDGAIIFEEKQICTENHNCMNYGGYRYQGETGEECVSAETCLSKEGWHPYSIPGDCLEIKPDSDGDFIERADGVCSCSSYSAKQH